MLLLVSDLEAPGGRDADLAYIRVAEDIAARITSGELAPGARLRSERDLAEFYGVSYGTVRRAMEVLRERELITTIHGRGTFVRSGSLPPSPRAPWLTTAIAAVATRAGRGGLGQHSLILRGHLDHGNELLKPRMLGQAETCETLVRGEQRHFRDADPVTGTSGLRRRYTARR